MGVCCGKGGAEEVEEMVEGGEGEVDFRGRHCGWCFVLVGRGGFVERKCLNDICGVPL